MNDWIKNNKDGIGAVVGVLVVFLVAFLLVGVLL
jgi:hypothetical protein